MSKYLENTWYCIGWSSELEEGPIGRTILDRPIVVFRTESGELAALGGACPHRFAPLANGKVCENTIACPYHGLVFDTEGQCIRNPHGPGGEGPIPPNAKVPKYPVTEKHGAVWIWVGDADKVNDTALNFFDWMASPDFAGFTDIFEFNANYEMIADNLMDLTHGIYVHKNSFASEDLQDVTEIEPPEIEFKTDPDHTIHSNYLLKGIPPAPLVKGLMGDGMMDMINNIRWRPGSIVDLDVIMVAAGGDMSEGFHQPSYHFITPKSEHESYYFYASGRNMFMEDKEVEEKMRETGKTAIFREDKPIIESCSDLMQSTDLLSLRPAILMTDFAAVQARRVLSKLIKDEQASNETGN